MSGRNTLRATPVNSSILITCSGGTCRHCMMAMWVMCSWRATKARLNSKAQTKGVIECDQQKNQPTAPSVVGYDGF